MLKQSEIISTRPFSTLNWTLDQSYQVLDKRIRVCTTEGQFANQLRQMMRSFVILPKNEPVDVTFSILPAQSPASNRKKRDVFFFQDGKYIDRSQFDWRLFRLLEWRLRAFLVRNSRMYHLFHAGSVSRDNVGILLPGRSKDGKSSLTLSLLLSGYQYYSDELTLVDCETGMIVPFPKPLSLRDLSHFSQLDPSDDRWLGPEQMLDQEEIAIKRERLWFIHPEDIRDDALGSPRFIRLILFLRNSPKETAVAQRLSAAEAMRELVDRSFNCSASGFRQMAYLAQTIPSFKLVGGDLAAKTALVDELVTTVEYHPAPV